MFFELKPKVLHKFPPSFEANQQEVTDKKLWIEWIDQTEWLDEEKQTLTQIIGYPDDNWKGK